MVDGEERGDLEIQLAQRSRDGDGALRYPQVRGGILLGPGFSDGDLDARRDRYGCPAKLGGFTGGVGELSSRRLEGWDEEAGECYGGIRDGLLENLGPAWGEHLVDSVGYGVDCQLAPRICERTSKRCRELG